MNDKNGQLVKQLRIAESWVEGLRNVTCGPKLYLELLSVSKRIVFIRITARCSRDRAFTWNYRKFRNVESRCVFAKTLENLLRYYLRRRRQRTRLSKYVWNNMRQFIMCCFVGGSFFSVSSIFIRSGFTA